MTSVSCLTVPHHCPTWSKPGPLPETLYARLSIAHSLTSFTSLLKSPPQGHLPWLSCAKELPPLPSLSHSLTQLCSICWTSVSPPRQEAPRGQGAYLSSPGASSAPRTAPGIQETLDSGVLYEWCYFDWTGLTCHPSPPNVFRLFAQPVLFLREQMSSSVSQWAIKCVLTSNVTLQFLPRWMWTVYKVNIEMQPPLLPFHRLTCLIERKSGIFLLGLSPSFDLPKNPGSFLMPKGWDTLLVSHLHQMLMLKPGALLPSAGTPDTSPHTAPGAKASRVNNNIPRLQVPPRGVPTSQLSASPPSVPPQAGFTPFPYPGPKLVPRAWG